jgi:hypothetical protein
MITATNPLLSNRNVSLLWKCRNSLLCNRHCYVTMEMQQTHYYTTVTHVTMEMQYNSLLHNRNCYVTMEMPSRPNISQYIYLSFKLLLYNHVQLCFHLKNAMSCNLSANPNLELYVQTIEWIPELISEFLFTVTCWGLCVKLNQIN